MYAGIDVSATRGFDVAVLDDDRRVALLAKARDLDAAGLIIRGLPPETVVAVDAPPAPSRGFAGAGKGYRVAEQELHRVGVSLYPVPSSTEASPAWMRAGFALYEVLEKAGFPPFLEGAARRGVSIEVYPHLTYRVLTGDARGRVPKLEWSRAALRRKVAGLTRDATQDALDAIAAAYTAWTFANDRWVGYGDPREGVIVAPRSDARDEAVPPGPDQLSLGIEATPRSTTEQRIPQQTPFAQRVMRYVAQIPPGRVATYGDVARACGTPTGARAVGTLVARRSFEMPSHRLVDATGRPSPAYPGGPERQLERLAAEGIAIANGRVDLNLHRWREQT
jgi:alkylated DNA nucleotide flippase Atl1/predicted nuclease with RNAse H fold